MYNLLKNRVKSAEPLLGIWGKRRGNRFEQEVYNFKGFRVCLGENAPKALKFGLLQLEALLSSLLTKNLLLTEAIPSILGSR